MSNVKCEVCGRFITRCPACFAGIPAIEVDIPAAENTNQETDWNYKTTLPTEETQQAAFPEDFPEETTKSALSQYFDENASACPCLKDDDGNILLNPNIQRESISAPSPYAPKKVRGSHGDRNVEELAKIAVDQQIRVEKRKRRRMRWIRRGIVFGIVLILILYNWDFVYFVCRTFLNGIGAAFEIFGLLGDLNYNPPIQ